MTRLSLAAFFAASLFGPWAGCDRAPVTPPAQPPGERASDEPAPAEQPSDTDGVLLLPTTRRLG
ncbi:MAG TPA: hypothetical protein VF405_07905 [Gammaproteobacteria bacterium]